MEREICMNTPVQATIKTTKNVVKLAAQMVQSFTEPLGYPAFALVCLFLILAFKYAGNFCAIGEHQRRKYMSESPKKIQIKVPNYDGQETSK